MAVSIIENRIGYGGSNSRYDYCVHCQNDIHDSFEYHEQNCAVLIAISVLTGYERQVREICPNFYEDNDLTKMIGEHS